jgi:ATP-dependent Clp protease ATP-binding subunit ClpA
MPNKMERFTQKARRVMSLAQDEAERLRHSTVGTEHLLLGLMQEASGVAGRVLRNLGIEPNQLTRIIGELSTATTNPSEMPMELSADTKQLLKLAVDEARRMGHHYIGTEHLLLGLVRQSDSVAVHVLKHLGISPEEVRQQTRRVLQEAPFETPQRPAPPASTKPSPPQESLNREHVTNTKAFEILRTAITQIFDMVAAEKLTTAQAAELLTALQPYLSPSTGQRVLLIAHALNSAGTDLEKRQIRIIIREAKNQQVVFELAVSLPEAMESLDTLLDAILTNYPGWLWAESIDENRRLEIRIEEDGE